MVIQLMGMAKRIFWTSSCLMSGFGSGPIIAKIVGLGAFVALSCSTARGTTPNDGARTLTKAVSSEVQEKKTKKWIANWALKLGSRSYKESIDQSSSVKSGASVSGNYLFNPYLEAVGRASLNFNSGRVQQRYKSGSDDSSFNVSEAQVKIKAPLFLEIHGGIQSQDIFENSLFLDGSKSMPGVREVLATDIGVFRISATAQQSLPTSSSFESERREVEELPRFESQTVCLEFGKDKSLLEAKIRYGRYKFSDLPSVVAYESNVMGNTVTGDVAANSHFVFKFAGELTSISANLRLVDWFDLVAAYRKIENSEAPIGFNTSESIETGFIVKSEWMTFSAELIQFYIESDVVPGFYNSASLGHTNRKGTQYNLEFEFPKQLFKVVASVTSADVINVNVDQGELRSTYLGLETVSVSF